MMRYDTHHRLLAFGFAALAGFVDAIGFVRSGGLFVSFMSGNSTRLAVGSARHSASAIVAASLIAVFVAGVVIGVTLGNAFPARRKAAASSAATTCLALAALSVAFAAPLPAIGLLCLAMGMSNTILQRDGDVGVGVTYMTGTLVKLGYRIADALGGGSRTGWIPYLTLWLSLVMGGIAGATAEICASAAAPWCAAAIGAVLTIACWRMGEEPQRGAGDT